jgi:hypothetical protein
LSSELIIKVKYFSQYSKDAQSIFNGKEMGLFIEINLLFNNTQAGKKPVRKDNNKVNAP